MAISMLKIWRPLGHLIFNMGIAIPGKTVFLIETAPWSYTQNPSDISFIHNVFLCYKFVLESYTEYCRDLHKIPKRLGEWK